MTIRTRVKAQFNFWHRIREQFLHSRSSEVVGLHRVCDLSIKTVVQFEGELDCGCSVSPRFAIPRWFWEGLPENVIRRRVLLSPKHALLTEVILDSISDNLRRSAIWTPDGSEARLQTLARSWCGIMETCHKFSSNSGGGYLVEVAISKGFRKAPLAQKERELAQSVVVVTSKRQRTCDSKRKKVNQPLT